MERGRGGICNKMNNEEADKCSLEQREMCEYSNYKFFIFNAMNNLFDEYGIEISILSDINTFTVNFDVDEKSYLVTSLNELLDICSTIISKRFFYNVSRRLMLHSKWLPVHYKADELNYNLAYSLVKDNQFYILHHDISQIYLMSEYKKIEILRSSVVMQSIINDLIALEQKKKYGEQTSTNLNKFRFRDDEYYYQISNVIYINQ